MAIDLLSAGVSVNYAVSTTGTTRPTTGYTRIYGIKEIPDLNPEPTSHQTTTLDAVEWHTYISGLKDAGGALAFTANHTEEFHTAWDTLVTAATTAKASNKATWMAIIIPGLTRAFYFSIDPSPMGLGSITVDAPIETSVYVSPTAIAGWAAKPTGV